MKFQASNTTAINPIMAREILSNAIRNRPIKKKKVEEFRSFMEGRKFGTSLLVFNSSDQLVSGFHRMTALSELPEDVFVNFAIAYDDDDLASIRQNSGSPETAREQAKRNELPYANERAAIARKLIILEHKLEGRTYTPGAEEIYTVSRDEPYMERAIEHLNDFDGLIPSPSIASYIILARENEEKTDLFYSSLSTGAGLELGSPILAVKNGLPGVRTKLQGTYRDAQCGQMILRGFSDWVSSKQGPTRYNVKDGVSIADEVKLLSKVLSVPWTNILRP